MPHGSVKTQKDEKLWQQAQQIAQDEYDLTEDDGDEYWKRVMGIYKQSKGEKKTMKKSSRLRRSKSKHQKVQSAPSDVLSQSMDSIQAMAKSVTQDMAKSEGLKIEVKGQKIIDGLNHRILHHRTKLERLEHGESTAKEEEKNAIGDQQGQAVPVAPDNEWEIKRCKRMIEEFKALRDSIKPKKTYQLDRYEYSDFVSEVYDG